MKLLFYSKFCSECRELVDTIKTNLQLDETLKYINVDNKEFIKTFSNDIVQVPYVLDIDPEQNRILATHNGLDDCLKDMKQTFSLIKPEPIQPQQQYQPPPQQQYQPPPQEQYQPPQPPATAPETSFELKTTSLQSLFS